MLLIQAAHKSSYKCVYILFCLYLLLLRYWPLEKVQKNRKRKSIKKKREKRERPKVSLQNLEIGASFDHCNTLTLLSNLVPVYIEHS